MIKSFTRISVLFLLALSTLGLSFCEVTDSSLAGLTPLLSSKVAAALLGFCLARLYLRWKDSDPVISAWHSRMDREEEEDCWM